MDQCHATVILRVAFVIRCCTAAGVDISAICCQVLSSFAIENDVSDICSFKGVILSPYNCN